MGIKRKGDLYEYDVVCDDDNKQPRDVESLARLFEWRAKDLEKSQIQKMNEIAELEKCLEFVDAFRPFVEKYQEFLSKLEIKVGPEEALDVEEALWTALEVLADSEDTTKYMQDVERAFKGMSVLKKG